MQNRREDKGILRSEARGANARASDWRLAAYGATDLRGACARPRLRESCDKSVARGRQPNAGRPSRHVTTLALGDVLCARAAAPHVSSMRRV
jgi:hypothetical protein